jgi:hypothetical protein
MIRISLRAERTPAQTYVCSCVICGATTEAELRIGQWQMVRQCEHFTDVDRLFEPVSFRFSPETKTK